jgi:hypothetical protein
MSADAAPAAAPGTTAGCDAVIRVLYIAGAGRSGSTLMSCLLGQCVGLFAAGEMRYLWQRGVIENRLCGCGLPFATCPRWQAVISAAGGVPNDVAGVDAAQRRLTRFRSLAWFLTPNRAQRRRAVQQTLSPLYDVYQGLAGQDGIRVIVDSSKLPTYALALLELPNVQMDVVHLVRDPRATAFSWQRWRQLPDVTDTRWMQRQSPAKSALLWLVWNLIAGGLLRRRVVGRYLRVRYEDLVDAPVETLAEIERLVGGADLTDGSFGTAVSLRPTHTVAGNPGRMMQGSVVLERDVEWINAMRRRDRWLVTLLTLPLLWRYGYRLRIGGKPELSVKGWRTPGKHVSVPDGNP